MALAFHELTTNAIKYGSLSNATGKVSVRWKLVGEKHHRRLELEWREHGGPPVAIDRKTGFGTKLLNRVFDTGSSGRVVLTFERSGLACEMRVALAHSNEGIA
jgi:two-component sensor histidine kinase